MLSSKVFYPYVGTPVELGLETDCQGIYIETTRSRIDAMVATGFLEFGVGDTRVDAEYSTISSRMRGHESSKNLKWQHYLLDSISTPGYRDYALHKEISQTFAIQLRDPVTGKRNEVFSVAVDKMYIQEFVKTKNFEPIRVWLSEQIRECASKLNPLHKKQSRLLRNIQRRVIKKVLDTLQQKGLSTNFVCELAARIGKTILFLELARTLREDYGHEAMFVMAYGVGLSVKTSYKNELSKFSEFECMQFVDASDNDADKQYQSIVAAGKMPIVFLSLNPEVEKKYEWVNQLSGLFIALLEETDFGTHTDAQVKKVEFILQNKKVTRFNASGTNIGRLAKAFGMNAVDEIISVPYCMVEQDSSIPNVVTRKFYNMLFNKKINKLLEEFDIDKDVLPNITKILSKPLSQQKFISALFRDMFGYQPIYGFNISDQAGVEILHTMLFVNITKAVMEQLAEVIERACPEHKVLILNGDYTINSDAEDITKEELVKLQNDFYKGRNKLLVITNMMGTRSYSIPEIQACLFMREGGGVYTYMQQYSRCLTPGFNKKHGYIFDFSFDQNKTRNTLMSVAVEAALLLHQGEATTYPTAVRMVLNSVNIKDVVSGQWICADDIIKQFEDNNKLLEVANAHTRITIEDLTSEEIDALGELASRSTGSKKERTEIEKVVKTGKTFEPRGSLNERPVNNPLKKVVEKAIRMINGSASTVVALANFQGESFLECISIINDSKEMTTEFTDLYGISPKMIIRLSSRLELSTLDVIVHLSKYNPTQKHIESNALALLKDDPALWREIFGNRKMRRFISNKRCKNILIAAGGYGTEVDVLVELFGVDIIEKITYNDKYSFMCNNIKHKYPKIKIIKGDFVTMKFDQKFDVVCSNPPYQPASNENTKNIWPLFLEMGFKLVQPGGYVALITPRTWTTNHLYADFFLTHDPIHINVDECRKYFPGVGSTFSYYILRNQQPSNNSFTVTGPDSTFVLSQLPTFGIGNANELALSVLNKTIPNRNKFDMITSSGYNTMKFSKNDPTVSRIQDAAHPHAVLHKTKNGKDEFFYSSLLDITEYGIPRVIINIWVANYEKMVVSDTLLTCEQYRHFPTSTLKEAETLKNILLSPLYKFIANSLVSGGSHTHKSLSQFPAIDLTRDWTNEQLYEHFKLTQEEIKLIEENIK